MNNSKRIERMREKLTTAFAPTTLDIIDESHKHAGHAGAQTGLGHFKLKIASTQFADANLLENHRRIYDALGEMMQTDIHALSIKIIQ